MKIRVSFFYFNFGSIYLEENPEESEKKIDTLQIRIKT